MNVNQLREKFNKLSIDQLVVLLDQYADEPTVESRMLEEVLAQKIGAMANEVKLPRIEEDAGDATSCPPITIPSGAAFESAVSRDINNSTEKHTDVIPTSCKPSPAPRWLSSDIAKPAVPDANILPPQKIHGDGVNAESFSGEVVPGLTFVNPGRQEERAVHTPLASEISTKGD